MKGSSVLGAMIGFATILMSASAMADTPPATSPGAHQKAQDPNEVVCEKQQVVGSRLQTRRVCRTRAEWADLRLQDRQDIDRAQTMQGMRGE